MENRSKAHAGLVFWRSAYQNDSVRGIVCLVLTAILVNGAESLPKFSSAPCVHSTRATTQPPKSGFQQVLKISPEHLGALQNPGLVYSRTNRIDEAIATIDLA